MKQVMTEVFCVRDGESTTPQIQQLFGNDQYVSTKIDFVGLLVKDNQVLISFPKHFCWRDNLQSSVQLLLQVLAKVQKLGIDADNELNDTFPFNAFLKIYDYYRRYGLYRMENQQACSGYSGTIDWQKTIQTVTPLKSGRNLIFMPLKSKQTSREQTLVTQCMIHALNTTAKQLGTLFALPLIDETLIDQSIDFSEPAPLIQKLRTQLQSTFRDAHRQLIESLITFLEKESEYKGGQWSLRLHDFSSVWEAMVNHYLNRHFWGVADGGLRFVPQAQSHFQKIRFYPDAKKAGYRIEPDYYYENTQRNQRYLFDAKYYQTVSELDYKQIAYYFLLKDKFNDKSFHGKTYNALIFPTEKAAYQKEHFHLKETFNRDEVDFVVYEQYLNMNDVMKDFVR